VNRAGKRTNAGGPDIVERQIDIAAEVPPCVELTHRSRQTLDRPLRLGGRLSHRRRLGPLPLAAMRKRGPLHRVLTPSSLESRTSNNMSLAHPRARDDRGPAFFSQSP